jgi:A/G-specific adenine glycosylase
MMHASLIADAQQHLLGWYSQHGRHHLPWRVSPDPYRIYLSEVMLQQTQVKTVMEDYYPRFLRQFPTLASVAEATLDDVLVMWQGLGYYRRAKYLHQTAIITQGDLPETVEALMALPGIGRNTAHAVMAFAYRQPYAVMEANVRRIIHRIYGMKLASERLLFEHATALLNHSDPFHHNQAMMDLGAMVCTPVAPLCGECPLASICQGKMAPESYPAPKAKKTVPTRKPILVLYADLEGKVALTKRDAAFLHGLYGLPELPLAPKDGHMLGIVKHVYSHFKLEASLWCVVTACEEHPQYHWAHLDSLPAISTADAKALALYRALLR